MKKRKKELDIIEINKEKVINKKEKGKKERPHRQMERKKDRQLR